MSRKDQQQPAKLKTRNFSHFASQVAQWCGSPYAFGIAVGIVLIWALAGPFFGYSENWQIVINTGTTIITFLMVFVIQSSQNRDGLALQLKLDEIIRTVEGARNALVTAEDMDETELKKLKSSFEGIAKGSRAGGSLSAETTAASDEDSDQSRAPKFAANARKSRPRNTRSVRSK